MFTCIWALWWAQSRPLWRLQPQLPPELQEEMWTVLGCHTAPFPGRSWGFPFSPATHKETQNVFEQQSAKRMFTNKQTPRLRWCSALTRRHSQWTRADCPWHPASCRRSPRAAGPEVHSTNGCGSGSSPNTLLPQYEPPPHAYRWLDPGFLPKYKLLVNIHKHNISLPDKLLAVTKCKLLAVTGLIDSGQAAVHETFCYKNKRILRYNI